MNYANDQKLRQQQFTDSVTKKKCFEFAFGLCVCWKVKTRAEFKLIQFFQLALPLRLSSQLNNCTSSNLVEQLIALIFFNVAIMIT